MNSRERMTMTITTKKMTTPRLEFAQTDARTHTRTHADTRTHLCKCTILHTQMNVSSIECNYYRTVVLWKIVVENVSYSSRHAKRKVHGNDEMRMFSHTRLAAQGLFSQLWMLLLLLSCDVEYDDSPLRVRVSSVASHVHLRTSVLLAAGAKHVTHCWTAIFSYGSAVWNR